MCPNVWYVPMPKLIKIGTFKPPVVKDYRKNYSVHTENFKADFSSRFPGFIELLAPGGYKVKLHSHTTFHMNKYMSSTNK